MDEPTVAVLALAALIVAHYLFERQNKACCSECAGKAQATAGRAAAAASKGSCSEGDYA